jgi:hypothetical protein
MPTRRCAKRADRSPARRCSPVFFAKEKPTLSSSLLLQFPACHPVTTDVRWYQSYREVTTMARTQQKGLRLRPEEEKDLKRIAEYEGRSEQDVLRDSLRMYVHASDDRRNFLASVEQGWVEIRSGLGEVVSDDDDFFETLSKEIRDSNAPT